MAKYKSLFQVSGDVGDAGFRLIDGQMVLGRTSSLDRNRIRTDPAFERTRENQKEFSAAAKATAAFRLGLAGVMKRFADPRASSRFTAVFKKMLNAGPGLRGQRTIEIMNQKAKLIGLNLHRSETVASVFLMRPTLTVNVDRNAVTTIIPVFNADEKVVPPRGATHFKLTLAVVALSDFEFDVDEKTHVPVHPAISGLGATATSAEIGVKETPATAINLMASLPGSPILGLEDGLIAMLGIEFFQEVNGQLSILKDKSAMHIVEVF